MIPSDHFVRFYNEVFRALYERGREHLVAYWEELGRLQTEELTESFRRGGLRACYDYWKRIVEEENCEADLKLTDEYFEFRMKKCPSLSKAFDNDAGVFELYCDHCMAWVQPAVEAAGLYPAHDMESRTEPHCLLRVYKDAKEAREFQAQAKLPADPYEKEKRK